MSPQPLPRYPPCFVCGRSNPAGLDVTFQRDGRKVLAEVSGKAEHTGYPGVMHGGILATVLDEAMGWAVTVATGRMVQTLEINVRYHRPLPPGSPVRIVAEMSEDLGRYKVSKGRIETADGKVFAKGEGKYSAIPLALEKEVLALLERTDGTGGVSPEELGPGPE